MEERILRTLDELDDYTNSLAEHSRFREVIRVTTELLGGYLLVTRLQQRLRITLPISAASLRLYELPVTVLNQPGTLALVFSPSAKTETMSLTPGAPTISPDTAK
jgi:hypothetical protein